MIRGNDRNNIFHDENDKLRFIEIIQEKQKVSRFALQAFCLMDNHIHLMLSEGVEDIAKVMKRINVSYVYYFNKKHKKVGHLFQDRFKSEVIEDDGYVLALARYIHQNPLKAGLVKAIDEYKWSSYLCYLNEDNYFSKMVDTETILGLFSKDIGKAKDRFKIYMKEEAYDKFIDLKEGLDEMGEETAKGIFKAMLLERVKDNEKNVPADLIKEFKEKTNLPLRKIAAITGVNKDKINKILRA